MSLLFAILLAGLCFAGIVFIFRLPRKVWTLLLAALVFGLAGYASQASPDLKGAPGEPPRSDAGEGAAVVDVRKDLVAPAERSPNPLLITADALARRGDYVDAAAMLRGIVSENPQDTEAWLALGNALTFQAEGMMTPASLYAYRKASQLSPDNAGPAFFIGWALIRQGKLIEGREVWAGKLEEMPEGTPGRDALAERLANFDAMLRQLVAEAQKNPQNP